MHVAQERQVLWGNKSNSLMCAWKQKKWKKEIHGRWTRKIAKCIQMAKLLNCAGEVSTWIETKIGSKISAYWTTRLECLGYKVYPKDIFLSVCNDIPSSTIRISKITEGKLVCGIVQGRNIWKPFKLKATVSARERLKNMIRTIDSAIITMQNGDKDKMWVDYVSALKPVPLESGSPIQEFHRKAKSLYNKNYLNFNKSSVGRLISGPLVFKANVANVDTYQNGNAKMVLFVAMEDIPEELRGPIVALREFNLTDSADEDKPKFYFCNAEIVNWHGEVGLMLKVGIPKEFVAMTESFIPHKPSAVKSTRRIFHFKPSVWSMDINGRPSFGIALKYQSSQNASD